MIQEVKEQQVNSQRKRRILDLLDKMKTDSGAKEFVDEYGTGNAA